MYNLKKSWFTLVELIVVITILAILGTIAFITFQWYTKNSRDSVRMTDLSNITKTMELYVSEKWSYPIPSNWVNINYSWATIWTQWIIWDSVITNLWTLNKKPLDPLFWNEYTYSLNYTKTEFQLASLLEWETVTKNNIINKTYANIEYPIAHIKWNYNWKIAFTSTWWIDYGFAIPSIISNDISSLNIFDIVLNNHIIYNNEVWVPVSYSGLTDLKNDFKYLSSWSSSLMIFSWHINTDLNWEWLFVMIDKLHQAYSWSIINPYSIDVQQDKSELAIYTWEIIRQIYWLPKLDAVQSCEDILKSWKSIGNWFYHFFSSNNSSIYESYCDMNNWWWMFLFSTIPSWTKWKYDSIEWTKPTYTANLSTFDILSDEITSGAYWEFKSNEIKVCRGNLNNCYIFKHNQNRTLKSFYNIWDNYTVYTRCYPNATYCDAWQLPNDYGDDNEESWFLSIVSQSQPSTTSYPRQWMWINVSLKNRIWVQYDHNNTWPDFDNLWYWIWVFRSRNCWYHDWFVDNDRARSVEGGSNCAYSNPDTQMWYVFAK